MNELKVKQLDGQAVMDSRDVAEAIDKKHSNLMRDISRYVSDISTDSKLNSLNFFIESKYQDAKGEFRKCYLLTKQGCEFVANKMTGTKGSLFTARYVNLFNEFEDNQRRLAYQNPNWPIPATYAEALQLAATQTAKLEKQKPMIDYYKSQMRNPGLMTITEIAKDYGWSAVKMNRELAKRKVQYRQGQHWVLYSQYADKGYASYEAFAYKDDNKRSGIHNNLKWTQRGRKFIYDLLAKDGIRPTLEQMDLLEG